MSEATATTQLSEDDREAIIRGLAEAVRLLLSVQPDLLDPDAMSVRPEIRISEFGVQGGPERAAVPTHSLCPLGRLGELLGIDTVWLRDKAIAGEIPSAKLPVGKGQSEFFFHVQDAADAIANQIRDGRLTVKGGQCDE